MEDYLIHYGILGMKWGVRRYQNYDGSYTRKGMEHYRNSRKEYDNAKELHKGVKLMRKESKKHGYVETSDGRQIYVTKDLVKDSKRNLKDKERQLKKDYKQLRKDKAGDIGKELYRSGKTITGSARNLKYAGYIAAGAGIASKLLLDNGKKDLAKYTAIGAIGLEAVNAIFAVKNEVEAHYLRAYYGHNRK